MRHHVEACGSRFQARELEQIEQRVGGLVHDLRVVAVEYVRARGQADAAARGRRLVVGGALVVHGDHAVPVFGEGGGVRGERVARELVPRVGARFGHGAFHRGERPRHLPVQREPRAAGELAAVVQARLVLFIGARVGGAGRHRRADLRGPEGRADAYEEAPVGRHDLVGLLRGGDAREQRPGLGLGVVGARTQLFFARVAAREPAQARVRRRDAFALDELAGNDPRVARCRGAQFAREGPVAGGLHGEREARVDVGRLRGHEV